MAFAQQPVILLQDQFNNPVTGDNSTVVSASRNAGSGSLQGTTNITAISGVVTFTNLSHNTASTISIDFASPGVVGATSSNVVVNAAAAASLAYVQPPTDALAGAAISPAVTIQVLDQRKRPGLH